MSVIPLKKSTTKFDRIQVKRRGVAGGTDIGQHDATDLFHQRLVALEFELRTCGMKQNPFP
ncbi:hypothetical protein M514_02794 [Trichuris suis]|uniref:Uncharacterized protein n=1 Tax=Trichuris suis TaxID=68888 RepID=A0A085N2T9_9BILA|nr:hypothetical protein M513_02794 [Trichuris suis]KFD63785.1 hypothetical protein M514_02794 [Trichuris suis]